MIRVKANFNEIIDERGDIETDSMTSVHVPACL